MGLNKGNHVLFLIDDFYDYYLYINIWVYKEVHFQHQKSHVCCYPDLKNDIEGINVK